MRKFLLVAGLLWVTIAAAQKRYPEVVESVLKQAGTNRPELEKVIRYFDEQKDSFGLKSAYFLISNMDIHYSTSYYWADNKGTRIAYNELAYPDFQSALRAFDELKKKYPGIHPVTTRYRDIDSMRSEFLINNIKDALAVWKNPWAKNISFGNFCEYILPYRVSAEPLQDWRNPYRNKFKWIYSEAGSKGIADVVHSFAEDYNKWFTNTYKVEENDEPLPALGPMQLLFRRKGACKDIAGLEVFTLRSQGIPASIDEIPYWATSSGKHFLNVTFDREMKPFSFDVSTPLISSNKLAREPAKVIRITYSRQPGTLVNFESPENIPDGFLKTSNYIDVTGEYWLSGDVTCNLSNIPSRSKIAYACVFNRVGWRAAWWGKVNNNSVTFSRMCKGAVFLPMYYSEGKLNPAGYPVASGYNHTMVLKPDTVNTHAIRITEQEGYLVFRPGKKYKLFYWNNSWKSLGIQTAGSHIREMVFLKVPRNALLLLLPEYTEGKERPFSIEENGQRLWW